MDREERHELKHQELIKRLLLKVVFASNKTSDLPTGERLVKIIPNRLHPQKLFIILSSPHPQLDENPIIRQITRLRLATRRPQLVMGQHHGIFEGRGREASARLDHEGVL